MAKGNRSAADGSNLFDAKQQAALEKQKEKRNGILIGVAVVLAVILMAGVLVYKNVVDSGYLLRREVAMESENFTVDGAMMAYFFRTNYQQYASYAEAFGIDTSVSLKNQASSMGGGTWFDYFMNMTEQTVERTLSLCEAANAAGVALDDEDKKNIDAYFDSMKSTASAYGYASFDQFLTLNYGGGIKEKDARHAMELSELANKYYAKFVEELSYTAEDYEAYYAENKDSFDSVSFLSYTVEVADFEETDDLGEVTNAEEARAAAEEQARIIAGAPDADTFKALVKDYLINVKGEEADHAEEHMAELLFENVTKSSGYDESVIEWAFAEDAAVGSATIITGDDTSYDAYYLLSTASRDETPLRDVRHILFNNTNYESVEAAQAAAEAVYAEWEAAGFTEEKFIELSDAHNEDTGSAENGGLYEGVTPGEMVDEFDAWLFDEARVAGDHELIQTESYGWHIMSYVGEGELSVWQNDAKTALSDEAYEAMVEANSASIVIHKDTLAHIAA